VQNEFAANLIFGLHSQAGSKSCSFAGRLAWREVARLQRLLLGAFTLGLYLEGKFEVEARSVVSRWHVLGWNFFQSRSSLSETPEAIYIAFSLIVSKDELEISVFFFRY
jgi:hypothetical protein